MPADGKDAVVREEETVVYTHYDHYTINVPFSEVRERWKRIKKGSA
jgi:hypothetical protein